MSKIVVLGSGGWGTALAVMAHNCGNKVYLWSPFEEELNYLRKDREHKKLLPGVKISEEIELTGDIKVTESADMIIMAVPSFAVRSTAKLLKDTVKPNGVIVNVAKGLEENTLKRLSEVIEEELEGVCVVALSGPSHAEEVSRGIPTAVVAASKSIEAAKQVQDTLMNENFRIYVTTDIVGVELGASLKNVIALCAGICDGLKLGDNTKAALITRGITEIAKLGVACGGKAQTFSGLTGIGDLIVTCTSMHSRNRRAGILIGEGMTPQEAIDKVGMTVEGYKTCHAAYTLAKNKGIEMPIVNESYHVLYENEKPEDAIKSLMNRTKKHEIEDLWQI